MSPFVKYVAFFNQYDLTFLTFLRINYFRNYLNSSFTYEGEKYEIVPVFIPIHF